MENTRTNEGSILSCTASNRQKKMHGNRRDKVLTFDSPFADGGIHGR